MRYEIRTDLALEAREGYQQAAESLRGVSVEEDYDEQREIRTTRVRIESENGAKAMGKEQGLYVTIEAVNLSQPDEGIHREVSEKLAQCLKDMHVFHEKSSVLVVGLGNEKITPDALGPYVVRNLHITRHIIREYGTSGLDGKMTLELSGLIPGVSAQTGMESLEIIQGVVRETQPELVIVVDALAARSTRRLSRTIQVTDTGIHPGSGVGNYRQGIHEKSLGVPVIGIGIPTVVDAATIVHDAMVHVMEPLNEKEREAFLGETITPQLRAMFVTPKDVDETVKRLSYTISEGIHLALQHE